MDMLKKISVYIGKIMLSLVLAAMLAVSVTSVSYIYDFSEPKPFSGPDIFDPYRNLDTSFCWKRANFHTHTKVEGIFNECDYWPEDVYRALERFGYDIVTFSNHNKLTIHPFDSSLQVNVYEHGYNLFKYHKLVFGCSETVPFDHLLPLTTSQKQFQLDILGKDSDIIQLNHPSRTHGLSKSQMEKLEGYQIMELDSGRTKENLYWDWALSAGHYSFALAGDDLHYPDRSNRIAVRCSFLCCPSAGYGDILETLRDGCYYSMRIPDYGKGDWETKYERNRAVPHVTEIGLDRDSVFIYLSHKADSIKFTGQNHATLMMASGTDYAAYRLKDSDPYARITAYFPDGEVIYSNVFARYDASMADSPFRTPSHTVNITLTIIFNISLLFLCGLFIYLIYRLFKRK